MRLPDHRPAVGRRRARVPVLALVACVAVCALGGPAALAADPTASPAVGDPRSPGVGPGFVGEPVLAIAAVVLIGLLALLATLAWVRMTDGRAR
jgi:hypothetical protein